MYRIKINLKQPVPYYLYDEFRKKIYFVCDEIIDFSIPDHKADIREVELVLSKILEKDELEEKIQLLLSQDVLKRKNIPEKIIWRNDGKATYNENIFEEMLKAGHVFQAGEGQIVIDGLFCNLMSYFDTKILTYVTKNLNAIEYRYPTLIPTRTLEKCGYFDSFPNFLMFVTRLHNDIDNYQSFKKKFENNRTISWELLQDHCKNSDYCLPPTMCYHTYHQFSGANFNENETRVVTACGKSFRYESKYHNSLERLWDFTIREIVFMGNKKFIIDARKKLMEYVFDFCRKMELSAFCSTANDPFFIDDKAGNKILFQKSLNAKYELQMMTRLDNSIAVGSFNYHDSFFGENFDIQFTNSTPIRTGCAGFGLERFVYAFLCQYGLDSHNWPDEIAAYVKGKFDGKQ